MTKHLTIALGTKSADARLVYWGGQGGSIRHGRTIWTMEEGDIKPRFAEVATQIATLPATGLVAEIIVNPGIISPEEAFDLQGVVHSEFIEHELAAVPGLRALVGTLIVEFGDHYCTSGSVRTCEWCGGQSIGTLAAGGGFHLFPPHGCLPKCVSQHFRADGDYSAEERVRRAQVFMRSDTLRAYEHWRDNEPGGSGW